MNENENAMLKKTSTPVPSLSNGSMVVEADSEAIAKRQTDPMVVFRFNPQAWQNNYAIPVDAKGETEFSVPLSDLPLNSDGELPADNTMESDDLRNHVLAPQWMQDWDGPFFIGVRNRDQIEAYLEAKNKEEYAAKPSNLKVKKMR